MKFDSRFYDESMWWVFNLLSFISYCSDALESGFFRWRCSKLKGTSKSAYRHTHRKKREQQQQLSPFDFNQFLLMPLNNILRPLDENDWKSKQNAIDIPIKKMGAKWRMKSVCVYNVHGSEYNHSNHITLNHGTIPNESEMTAVNWSSLSEWTEMIWRDKKRHKRNIIALKLLKYHWTCARHTQRK